MTSVQLYRFAGSKQDGDRIKNRASFESWRIMVAGVGDGDDETRTT